MKFLLKMPFLRPAFFMAALCVLHSAFAQPAPAAAAAVDMQTSLLWTSTSQYSAEVDASYWDAGSAAGTGVAGRLKLSSGLLGVKCGTQKGLNNLKYDPATGEVTVINISASFNPNATQVEHIYCRVPCQVKPVNVLALSQVKASNELPKQVAIKNTDQKSRAIAPCKCGPGMPTPAEACPGGEGRGGGG